MGHVFSPYYARARRLEPTDPTNHCALNVALYGQTRRWALTEHAAPRERTADCYGIGNSTLRWQAADARARGVAFQPASAAPFLADDRTVVPPASRLHITIDERTAPWGTRISGEVVLTPMTGAFDPVELAPGQLWWPVAPCARVEVNLSAPSLRWSGRAYHDTNTGNAPLDTAFGKWTWLRALHPEGTAVGYHIAAHGARPAKNVGRLYRNDGTDVPWTPPPLGPGPRTLWGVAQQFPTPYSAVHRCEDGPFYTRNRVHLDHADGPLIVMQESLDLERFAQPWVQFLVPFRMRRARQAHAMHDIDAAVDTTAKSHLVTLG